MCVGIQTDKPVMGRTILLEDEMHVIGCNNLDPHFFGQLKYAFVGNHLVFIDILREPWNFCLVTLDFQVIVFAEKVLVPFNCPSCSVHVPAYDFARNFAGNAG